MKYLFLLAHPDDEVVACGGTIKKLTDEGNEVVVVLATCGESGEVKSEFEKKLKAVGSVEGLRKREFARSCEILGVKEKRILKFRDGKINNETVWGKLTVEFVGLIDKYKPDAVVTFDHSGWYFHLDHVGVSIAATIAYEQAKHRPELLLFTLHKPTRAGTRWKYVFPDPLPATHWVDIAKTVGNKIKSLQAHESQDFSSLLEYLRKARRQKELFQLARATKKGEELIKESGLFKKVKK